MRRLTKSSIINYYFSPMKKLLFLLFLPSFIHAQKCKYDLDTYDKFQKIRKVEKEIKVVKKFYRGNGYLTLRLCKYGNDSFFRLYTASDDNIIVGRGDALIILFSNEETLKIYPSQSFFSDYNGARYLFEGTYSFIGSDFDKLKTMPVKSIRLYSNSTYRDFDIKESFQKELLNEAKCF